MNGIRDRAIGALAGLALGDVLGMPTRSMSRSRIAGRYGPITGLRDAAPDQPIAPGLPAGTATEHRTGLAARPPAHRQRG
jgi:ADP-ribosylglycohydrolase